jgi:chromosome partitioning protein
MAEDRRFAPPRAAFVPSRAAFAPAGAAFGSSGMAGHVVVVGNLKGGSGKSTLVINLASALAEVGRRVAILDCDPQGTASAWASRGHAAVPVRFEPLRNLNGAGSWLVTAGEMRRGVDVLLIDLPGVVAPAMGTAFLIASLILIPVAPQAVDVEGTRRVMAHLDKARAERPQAPPQALLVPVRVRELERGLVPWQDLLEPLALPMTPPLRHQVAFDRAFEEGRWVGERFPGSDAHREVQAVARRVLDELDRAVAPPAFGLARPRPARELELAEAPAGFDHSGARRPWWRRVLGG